MWRSHGANTVVEGSLEPHSRTRLRKPLLPPQQPSFPQQRLASGLQWPELRVESLGMSALGMGDVRRRWYRYKVAR